MQDCMSADPTEPELELERRERQRTKDLGRRGEEQEGG